MTEIHPQSTQSEMPYSEIFKNEINDATKLLFTLFFFATYCGLALLTIGDVDFFSQSRKVTLPIISLDVPIILFVGTSSAILTTLYVALHLTISRIIYIFNTHARNPSNESLYLSLHVPLFLRWFFSLSPRPSILERIVQFLFVLPGSIVPPVVLGFLWKISLVRHHNFLSGIVAVCFFITIICLILFCLSVFGRRKAITNPVAWALILIGFVIFFVLTTERTGSTRLLASLGWVEKDIMVAADLTGARISEVSNSYAHRFHWVREFAANYQQKDGNGSSYESPTSSFEDEWYERRRSYIASIIKPNLKGVDFRRAALENVYLVDVNLENSKFDYADLERAELESIFAKNASFRHVDLRSAHLEDAHLENAIFYDAKMDRVFLEESFLRCTEFKGSTVLFEARMDGAFLDEARFERIDLRRASMRGVYFKRAQLGNSDMQDVDLSGAIIWHSDLSKVKNLTIQQLENVLIDRETKLPAYLPAEFKPKRCWEKMQTPPFPYRQPWWTRSEVVINRAICGRKSVPLPDLADCSRK